MKALITKMVLLLATTSLISPALFASDESFTASIRILKPTVVAEARTLDLGTITTKNDAQVLVVSAEQEGTASFKMLGELSQTVQAEIVEETLTLEVKGSRITVNNFKLGGSLAPYNHQGALGNGSLQLAQMGATIDVPANSENGLYSGDVTLRIIY